MKKGMFGMFLILVLVLLTACSSTPVAETGSEETPAPAVVPPMSTVAPAASESNPAEVTEPVLEKEEDARLEIVLKLIGHPVQELYDAIGQPESVDYAPSCLGSGEDGELQYGAFTVYTYKEGNSETVQSVS